MTRIVRTHYRLQAPGKRRAAAIEVPRVVTIDRKTRRKASNLIDTSDAAEVTPETQETPSSPRKEPRGKPVQAQLALPANDDRKSAIVTARKPGRGEHSRWPTAGCTGVVAVAEARQFRMTRYGSRPSACAT